MGIVINQRKRFISERARFRRARSFEQTNKRRLFLAVNGCGVALIATRHPRDSWPDKLFLIGFCH